MTNEAMRVAIAEYCGFKDIAERSFESMLGCPTPEERAMMMFISGTTGNGLRPLPNYPGSLDAMAEAEKVFEGDCPVFTIGSYTLELADVIRRELKVVGFPRSLLVRATAQQRAEAFLKTVGLWRDS